MPDIFDEVAGSPKATTGDIFDQVAAQPAPTIEQATALPDVPRLPKINLFKGVTPAPRDRSIAEGLIAQQAENQGYGTFVEPNRTSFFTNRDPFASGVQTASSTPQVNLSPVEQPPAKIDTGSYSDPTSEKRQALEHLKNRGTFGPAIEQVAKGATDLADSGVLERTTHDINAGPTAQPTPEELQQGLSGASDLMEGSGTLASPLIAEGLATNALHSAGGLAAGVAASAAAGEVADKLGATPQEKRFAENLGFWGPTMLGRFIKPSVSLELSPEAKSMVGEAFGGKVAGGVEITPDEIKIGGKIGGKKVGARIPRGTQEPQGQTIEGESPTVTNAPTAKEPVAALPEENTRPEQQAPSTEPIAPSTETNQPFTETSAPTTPDRRQNPELRKRVEEMTPEERAQALLTSETTGLPNRRAFDEAQQTPAPAIAMSDADGLKALNDKFGYEAGNAMLHAKADALQQAGVESYHDKGDEFLYRGESPEALQQKLENARAILRDTPIQVTLPDGSVKYFKGADFSYGTGQDLQEAETGLKAHKSSREAAGQRARGELRGIAEYPVPAGNEGGVPEAHQAPDEQASAEVEPTRPAKPAISNDELNQRYRKQKAALTRAENISDPQARKAAVLKAASDAVAEWQNWPGWPDNWSRWQRAIDDAYLKANHASGNHEQAPQLDELPLAAAPAPTAPAEEFPIPGGFKKGEFVYHNGERVRVERNATIVMKPVWPPNARGTRMERVEVRDQKGGIQSVKPEELSREPQPKGPATVTPQVPTRPQKITVADARRMGAEAFARGDQSVPAHDKALMDGIGTVPSGERPLAMIALLDAWSKGWHEANLHHNAETPASPAVSTPPATTPVASSQPAKSEWQTLYDEAVSLVPDKADALRRFSPSQLREEIAQAKAPSKPSPIPAIQAAKPKAPKAPSVIPPWERTSPDLNYIARTGKPGYSMEDQVHIALPDQPEQAIPNAKAAVYRDQNGNAMGALKFEVKNGKPEGLQVFVKPEARRQGIASKLYETAQQAGYDVESASGTAVTPDGKAFIEGRRAKQQTPSLQEHEVEIQPEPQQPFKVGDRVEYVGALGSYRRKALKIGFMNSHGTSVRLDNVATGERLGGWFSPTELKHSDIKTPEEQRMLAEQEPEAKPDIFDEAAETANVVQDVQHIQKSGLPALAESVYQKLKAGESLGNNAAFNTLAEQSLGAGWRTSADFSPKDAYDAMEAGVNKYLADVGKELMGLPAEEGLARLKQIEQLLPTQNIRTDEQISHQQFSTPPRESYLVARVADVQASDSVLEPSAGNGGLAVFPKSVGATVYVNEIAPRRVAMLKEVGFDKITSEDGETINARLPGDIKPTVVIMNPPFSAKASAGVMAKHMNKFGFNHVDQALQRLQDGGRLVAILGGGRDDFPTEGATFANAKADEWFSRMAKKYNIRANVRVSGKEYQKYGTTYATRIIVIDKNGPTPIRDGDWHNSVVQGASDTLEQAYNLLRPIAEDRANVTTSSTRPISQTSSGIARPQGSMVPAGGSGDNGLGTRPGEVPAVSGQGQHLEPAGRPAGDTGLGGRAGGAGGNGSGAGNQPLSRPESDLQPAGNPAGETAGRVPAAHSDIQERPLALDGRGLTPPEKLDITQDGERSDREEEDTGAYVTYHPTLKGPAHPGNIVESKTMATVPLPKITYQPSLPESILKEGKLSAVQLEAVALAGQQNNIILPGGFRSSLLIGDGTGLGKGRESAAILLDNWRQGRTRLMWVSKNWDLMQDALRDLNGIGWEVNEIKQLKKALKKVGAHDLAATIVPLNDFDASEALDHKGIIFSSYATLRGGDKKGNKRITQVEKWIKGEDNSEGAYILFDESHNLKNAVTVGRTPPSEIGRTVKEFLQRVPNLRTVSLSATAASDVANLGYLDRLGLWGPGTPFPDGFQQFMHEIGTGGLSAMEMVARELKAQGKYVARTLSFKGATYDVVESPLNEDQKEIYRTAAKAWRMVQDNAETTIRDTLNGGGRARGNFLSQFYAAQQRFYNLLITTLKAPAAIEIANKALADGKSVVITLVNTNEAAQNREKNRVAADTERDDEEPPDYDFGPKRLLIDVIKNAYPTQQWEDAIDDEGRPYKKPATDKDGNPLQNPEAVRAREELIAQVERDLNMPENPLDVLINSLGGPKQVAELTGRKERFDSSTGKLVKRGGDGVPSKKVNIEEAKSFQAGKKRVAVLSSAADTGISLHADLNAKNQQRRVHITLQAGWSADRAMQMLGRTLRSNQASAPEYILLASDVAGEKRFLSSIARRMGSLGALSRGQKSATTGTDALDKFNFETNEGRAAARAFYDALEGGVKIPTPDPKTLLDGMSVLRQMGVLKPDANRGESVPDGDKTNITRMFNRLLGLDPDVQNAVFDYYMDIFQAVVQRAIDDGTLDTGVRTLPGDEFHVKEERAISSDPATGAKTFYYPVEARVKVQRVPPDLFDSLRKLRRDENGRVLVNDKGHVVLAYDARPIVSSDGTTKPASYIVTPENRSARKVANHSLQSYKTPEDWASHETLQNAQDDVDQFRYGYNNDYYREQRKKAAEQRLEIAKRAAASKRPLDWARELWQQQYDAAPDHEAVEHHLIGGAVLRWWNAVREAADQQLHVFTTLDSKTGKRVVGVEIPADSIRKLVDRISGSKSTVTGGQLATDVIKSGLSYTLEQNVQVKRGRVAGVRDYVIQLIPPNDYIARHLKDLGVQYERGMVPVYYIPTINAGGGRLVPNEATLDKVLKEYPIASSPEGEVNPANRIQRIPPGPGAKTSSDNTGLPSEVPVSPIGQVTESLKRMASPKGAQKITAPASQPQGQESGAAHALDVARQAIAAVTNSWKRGAINYDNFDYLIRDWDGGQQEAGIKFENFLKAARKAHPDSKVQDAMRVALDESGPDSIKEHAELVKDRAPYDKALNLTPEERTTVNNLRGLEEAMLEEAIKVGMMESGVEAYILHAYKRPWGKRFFKGTFAELNFSSLQPNPSFTKRRVHDTYADAEVKAGLVPKTKSAFDLVAMRYMAQAKAIADRALIKQILTGDAKDGRPWAVVAGGMKMPKGSEGDESTYLVRPRVHGQDTGDYVLIDHPALRRWKWVGEDENGKVFLQGDAYVHPEIASRLKNILGKSKIREFEIGPDFLRVRPGQAALRVSSEFKGALLGFGGIFHQTTLAVHALEHRVNPFNLPQLDMEQPMQRRAVHGGLMVFDARGMAHFSSEGVSASESLIGRIPGIHWYTSYLFKNWIPRLKMAMWLHARERNEKRYGDELRAEGVAKFKADNPTMSDKKAKRIAAGLVGKQLDALTADQANAAFGELNYTALARNKTLQDTFRLIGLSPDFTEARGRFVGQAARGYGREQFTALAIGAAVLATSAAIINSILNNGNPRLDHPMAIVYKGHVYSLRTVQGDVLHLADDIIKHGFPREFMSSRLNPTTARTALEAITGRDDRGQKRTTTQQAKDFATRVAPIPTQGFIQQHGTNASHEAVSSLLKMIGVNSKRDQTPAQERATELAMESGHKPTNRPQAGILSMFRKQIAEGQFDRRDLDRQVAEGKITPKDRTAILKQTAQTKLRRDFSQLSLDDALNVWGEMNDQEREQMRAVLRQKAEKELSRYPAGPEKQALRQKVDEAMAPKKSVLPGFLRKFSSSTASPTASK